MNTIDYITLSAFFKENCDFIKGSRIIKIQQPTKRELLLTLKNNNQTRKLYINIDPTMYHMCFVTEESLKMRNITIPKKPPMFCMLLRKYIDRFKISEVKIPYYERIFEIFIDSYDELNQNIRLCLTVELMGKHSNIILYNDNTKTIIGCAHNVGSEKSKYRELSGTLPYIYPPKQNKSDILNYNGSLNYDMLNETFYGISIPFQNQLKANNIALDTIKDFIRLDYKITPTIKDNDFSIYSELLPNGILQESVNKMLDNYFSRNQQNIVINSLKTKLLNMVNPLYNKVITKIKTIDNALNKEDKAAKYNKYGDLILSNIHNGKDYSPEIKVRDWDTDCEITIKLDKQLTLKENAQYYYKLYRKSKNKREIQTKLKESLITEKNRYEQLIYSINNSDRIDLLTEIEMEFSSEASDSQNKKAKVSEIEEIQTNKYTIYIGKNNKQNDYIVSKLSSPEDYWFHIKDSAGSHILLKMKNKVAPDEKTIYECCKLAKTYSSGKLNKKCPIIYTQRKYLRKPPKADLGYVTYKNEKEIIVGD